MKKKKDKVTLKEGEVDKPEVFQHFIGGIDPYHIEPIDNPQKLEMRFIHPIDPLKLKEVNGILNADFEHTGEEVQNSRGFFTSKKMTSGEIVAEYLHRPDKYQFNQELLDAMKYYTPAAIVKERTPEDVMMELKAIKMFYPEVLKQFLEDDNTI